MSVSGVGSCSSTNQLHATSNAANTEPEPPDSSVAASTNRSNRAQFRSDFASLLNSVQSGDMSSAQQALSAVQGDLSSFGATYSAQSAPGTSPVSTDLQSLFDAVQKGDASAAQQALTQLQSDAQQQAQAGGVRGHHRHHHHHHPSSGSAESGATTSATPSVTDPANDAATVTA